MRVHLSPAILRLIMILKRVIVNGNLKGLYSMKVGLLLCDM